MSLPALETVPKEMYLLIGAGLGFVGAVLGFVGAMITTLINQTNTTDTCPRNAPAAV